VHLYPLDQAELFDAAVMVLYRPRVARPAVALKVTHLDAVGGPQLNVAICGDDLEDADQPKAFGPDDAPRRADLDLADRAQSRPIRINFAVTLQARQPSPAERVNQLQVLKAEGPTIERYAAGRKASPVRFFEHRLEVVVLRQRALLLIKDAAVNGDVPVAIRPQKRNQVHHVVLARPMARDKFHLAGVGLIQCRVVYDKDAFSLIRFFIIQNFSFDF
jgi:hypothetical protein